LGNEVWLIGMAGVLIGAFPGFEGRLLTGLYPLVIAILALIVLRDMALHLRSRKESRAWRAGWDRVFVTGSAGLAVVWGLVIGNLLQGVPADLAGLITPYALLCGLAFPVLLALHAAAFLALRTRGTPLADAAVSRGRRLLPAVIPLMVLTAAAGVANPDVRSAAGRPIVGIALALLVPWAAVTGGLLLTGPRRAPLAFALTSLAIALPVPAVGFALSHAMGAGLADSATLTVLNWAALPILPIILVYQVWLWTAFRSPVDRPAYW
jgi:cytochrome d ubiquinol oxidase subunit II